MSDLLTLLWPPLVFLFISWLASFIAGFVTCLITVPKEASREPERIHTGVLPIVPMPATPLDDETEKTLSQFSQGMHESIMRLLAECEAASHKVPEEMHIDVFLSRVEQIPNYVERVRMGALWLDSGYETLDGLEQAMKEQYGE